MQNVNSTVLITLAGIACIAILNSFGAILSRKLNFNFSRLVVLSFTVYITVAYFVSAESGKIPALLSAAALGVFDATAGWKISKACNANFGIYKEMTEKISIHTRVLGTVLFSLLLGFIGYWLS